MTRRGGSGTARYLGWVPEHEDRARLLARVPPAYPRVVAHHVTQRFGVPRDAPPPADAEGLVIGVADDGQGVQALVLEVAGRLHRPDGGAFHITWSLAPNRQPRESNDIIARLGWTKLPTPIAVRLLGRAFG